MDKVKLEFKIPENKVIEYKGFSIEIQPFLPMAEQIILINAYLQDYFQKKEDEPALVGFSAYNYLEAEYNLIHRVFTICTNIDTENIDNELYVDQKLITLVKENIENYGSFQHALDKILSIIQKQIELENSLGVVLNNLLEKASVYMDALKDTTPEELEKLQKQGLELIDKLDSSPIIKESRMQKSEDDRKA